MAYRVIWSPRALDDIESIASYIARDSAAYASAVVAKIIKATRTLRRFPLAGRIVPEFEDENLRERFVYSYRIIYRIEADTITVAAVIHGRRLLSSAWAKQQRDP
jgi:addiction module RelE/StbE family toxin